MADLDVINQAFKKAQAAGDTENATRFAQMLVNAAPPAPPQPEVGVGEAFSRGFERGLGRLGSTVTDIIPALVGSAFGAEEYAQEQFAEAAEKEAALPAPVFGSFKEIEGVGDFTKFVSETIGEQLPNLGVTLATALTGGAAAPALVGATRAAGQLAGAGFGSYALNAPEIFQNIYQETGETAPGAALLFGSAAAALDSILPAALAKNISGPMKIGITEKILEKSGMSAGVLRSGTAGLAKGFGTEGLTEGAQEAISIAAERFIDENPDIFGSDEWNRIMEASVRGAVAGGGFGAVGGGAEGARGRAERGRRLADITEARKLRDKARQREKILGGQLDLPGVETLDPDVVQARLDREASEAGTGVPIIVSMPYALEVARRLRPTEVPDTGTVKGLTEEQQEVVKEVQQQESERILYEDAAVEAQRQGVAFDTTKPVSELSVAELEIIDIVAERRKGLFGAKQKQMFTKEGELAPAVKRQAKAFEREQAALEKAAAKEREQLQKGEQTALPLEPSPEEQAVAREREALDEAAIEQRIRNEAEQTVRARFEGSALPANFETQVAEEVEIIKGRSDEAQGDIFAGMPEGEVTRAPAVGKELNDFLKEQGLPVNKATKDAFAGLDLAIPEQRQQAINNLKEVAERSGSTANVRKIDDAIERLGGTPVQTIETVEAAEVTPAEEAQIAELTAVEPTAQEPTAEELPAGKEAIKAEIEEASSLAANIEAETTNLINRDIYEAKYQAGRIPDASALSSLTASEQEQALADNVFPEDTEAVIENDGLYLGLSRLLSAYRGYTTGSDTGTANPEAAQLLVEPIEKIIGKEQATALLPSIPTISAKQFNELLSAINSDARTSVGTTIREEILPKYQRLDLKTPAYQGEALNEELAGIARRGNFRQLITRLIPNQSTEIQRVLRKISGLGLTTKVVVGPTPEGTSGFYDPVTNTITLDPETGLNEHTFLHEAVHAAISQVLNDRNNPLTKQFFEFYSQIHTNIDGFYGGQDLQEFAAELVGNPEFQAYLKQVKAPESRTMWQTIMDALARFFGFRKGETAYSKGLDFIDQILDVSQGVEPSLTDKLFLGTPKMSVDAMSELATSGADFIGKKRNRLFSAIRSIFDSEGGQPIARNAMRVLRLQDFIKMVGDKIPQIKLLQEAILRRQGLVEKRIKRVIENYRGYERLAKELPEQMNEMGRLAIEFAFGEYDAVGVDPEFNANKLSRERKAEFNTLMTRFNRLDKRVRDMYADIRKQYRDSYEQYRKFVLANAANEATRKDLEKQFEKNKPLIGYVPAQRFGDFYLEYDTPSGERYVDAFENADERTAFIEENKNRISNVRPFNKIQEATRGDFPPSSFVQKLVAAMPTKGLKDQVQDAYLSFYPEQSIMQRFRKRKETPGASTDIVRVYGDTMVKWTRKLSNLETMPEIDKYLSEIQKVPSTGLENAIRREIVETRGDFIRNPNYGSLTSFFTTGAYNLFLTGNISAAIVNLSAVPLLALPLLSGPFGFGKANSAVLKAMKTAMARGDNGWIANPRYVKLAEMLDIYAQRTHTMQREILDGARQRTQDFDSLSARLMNLASVPFTEAEMYSRSVTAIAAYELAMTKRPPGKQYKNMTQEQAALQYAVDTVMNVNTSGMAAEGPSIMQNPIGRVMGTFKTFIWNSATVTALAMQQAGMFKPLGVEADPDAEIRAMARRQVIGIYGMSAGLAGINGLPFFGAAATFANIINAIIGDEDEPFNAKEEMRLFTNEFIFKGPLNYLTNLEISNRIGLANGMLFREDPYSVEQNGYIMTALMQAMGPVGSYALGIERNAGKFLEAGEYGRFFEAISPSALRNIFKTGRFIKEGARTIDGAPIDTDINAYNLFMQSIGFTPADLSSLYENRAAALNYEAKVEARKQKILKKYFVGVTSGDTKLTSEAEKEFAEFSMLYPELVGPDTLQRSFRSRQSYEQQMIAGLRFNQKLNNPFIREFTVV